MTDTAHIETARADLHRQASCAGITGLMLRPGTPPDAAAMWGYLAADALLALYDAGAQSPKGRAALANPAHRTAACAALIGFLSRPNAPVEDAALVAYETADELALRYDAKSATGKKPVSGYIPNWRARP